MPSIDRRGAGWSARWRDYPGGPQQRRTFRDKAEAEQFLEARLEAADSVDAALTTLGRERHVISVLANMPPELRGQTRSAVALGANPKAAIEAAIFIRCCNLPAYCSAIRLLCQAPWRRDIAQWFKTGQLEPDGFLGGWLVAEYGTFVAPLLPVERFVPKGYVYRDITHPNPRHAARIAKPQTTKPRTNKPTCSGAIVPGCDRPTNYSPTGLCSRCRSRARKTRPLT